MSFNRYLLTMNALLAAVILMWIALLVSIVQHIFQVPKWFADPPASFTLIRKQHRDSRMFWIPFNILFFLCISVSLIEDWDQYMARNYTLMGLASYLISWALSVMYFSKEILAFSVMSPDAPKTPELIWRTRTWLRWTTARDILQLFAAIFLTLAHGAMQ